MARIVWSQEARTWVRHIYNFIAVADRTAAKKVAKGIAEKVQLLAEFPELGYRYQTERQGEIRIMHYGHYRIAYSTDRDTVNILGVYHGAMDISKRLPSPPNSN